MKIADLDIETRGVLFCAHIVARWPTQENLGRLRTKLAAFDAKHDGERTANLLNALWGPNGIMHEEENAPQA